MVSESEKAMLPDGDLEINNKEYLLLLRIFTNEDQMTWCVPWFLQFFDPQQNV